MQCNTENPNCAVGQCVSWRCNQCADGYFSKSFDYPCTTCAATFGIECPSCVYDKDIDEKEKQHEFKMFLF